MSDLTAVITKQDVNVTTSSNVITHDTSTDVVEVNFVDSQVKAVISTQTPELSFGGFNTIIQNTGGGVSTEYQYLTDDQGRYLYHAKAVRGSPTDQSVWRIYRIDTSVQPNNLTQKSDGDNFTQIWDNRYTLTYT